MARKIQTERNFFLKQVDPVQVAEDYLSGKLKLPKDKIKFGNITITPDLDVGKDYNSPVYEIIDKNGESVRIITTDHDKWIAGSSSTTPTKKYICHWCRIQNEGESVVIPVKIDRDVMTNKLIFYGTGSYCCFECAFADLKTKWYCNNFLRDALYSDSESLLRFMHYKYTDKEKLVASPNWVLHEKNGGALSDKDFFSDKTSYIPAPNIIINNIKTTYFQTNK